MAIDRELGPLRGLVGTWEGDAGLDVAFLHSRGEIGEQTFRERATFNPFGPVENGEQTLYGLDYRTAAWRPQDEDPFHTEVGYWLWDGAAGEVMRCFMVPRGSTIIAGGDAHADDTRFTMKAECGSETCGILSNTYLARAARTTLYEVTVDLSDGTYSYESTTTIEHARLGEPLEHTDRNVLRRVE